MGRFDLDSWRGCCLFVPPLLPSLHSWRLEGHVRNPWRWLPSPWVLLELKMVLKQRRTDLKLQRFIDEVRFVRAQVGNVSRHHGAHLYKVCHLQIYAVMALGESFQHLAGRESARDVEFCTSEAHKKSLSSNQRLRQRKSRARVPHASENVGGV